MQEIMEPPMQGEEMSKLEETECEINGADKENNGSNIFSDEYEDDTCSSSEEQQSNEVSNPKELRDIAEGKNLNNSFLGSSYPEPENWGHLHFDKGPNPQFEYLDTKNNIFDLAAKIFGLNKK